MNNYLYKRSGLSWLGNVPEHWHLIRNKYLFREINEKSETGKEGLLSVSQYTGVTRKADKLTEGDNLTNAETLEGYKKVAKNDLVTNIMLAWNGSLGMSEYEGIVSPAYAVYRLKQSSDIRYLHYLFRTPIYKAEFKRNSTGVIESRLRLYTDDFFRIFTVIPPLKEQRTIARFLNYKTEQIDRFIANKQKLIALLKEQRTAIINKAVTKGLDANASMKHSGIEWLGEIPEYWEVRKLKYVANIIYGQSPHENTYNDKGEGVILINGPVEYSASDFGYTRSLKWTNDPKKFAPKHSILFCLRGSTTGRLNICHEDLSIGRGVAALVPTKLSREYFIYALRFLRTKIAGTFKGSTFPSVISDDLNNYKIPLPSTSDQSAIGNYLSEEESTVNEAILKAEKEIELIKEYRQSLIVHAVLGKIDVRDWQPEKQNVKESGELEEEAVGSILEHTAEKQKRNGI